MATDMEVKLAKRLAELEEKLAAIDENQKGTDGLGAALERGMAKAAEIAAGPTAELTKRLIPENKIHPKKGPYEWPEGGEARPKPKLHRVVHFNSQRQNPKQMTPAEILATNALSESLGKGQRRVSRDGRWVAKVSDNGEILNIVLPIKTMDDRGDLPSWLQIVTELTGGERAVDPSEMAAELAVLRSQVAELRGAAV